MNISSFTGAIYKITDRIMKLAYVNILWLLFTLGGLVFLGFFPATVSLFSVCRNWIIGEDDDPIFKTYWKNFKQEFLRSNILGLILTAFTLVLYLDYLFLIQIDTGPVRSLIYLFVPLIVLSVLAFFYIFPVYTHYNSKISEVIKNACFIMLLSPLTTFLMLISSIVICLVLFAIPGLILFFGVSVPAWTIMYFAHSAFDKVDKKKESLEDASENKREKQLSSK